MSHQKRPLEGVTVVDFATFIAGPSCTRYLGDLGATVIKVEAPNGDPMRYTAITEGRPVGELENTGYDLENANKSCICLNTKTAEGREALEKLIAEADIFVTNVRYKSLTKTGLDYDALKVKYPKLVYGYVTGYGEEGADSDLPGFDFTAFFARGGILGTLFDKDHVPMNTMPGFGDHPVGIYLASGILAALYRARETGEGDKVSVSLLQAAVWAVAIMLQSAQFGNPVAQYPISRRQTPNPLLVAHKTKDNRWLQIAMPAYDVFYNKFVTVLGRTDLLDDPRYFPHKNLGPNTEEFYEILRAEFAKQDLAQWKELLTEADLPFAVAQTWDEVLKDPQVWDNHYLYELEYSNGAKRALVRTPVTFQETPLPDYKRGPFLGEQTEQVLSKLGYSDEQVKAMLAAGQAKAYGGNNK